MNKEDNISKNYWFWVVVILVFSLSMFYIKLDLPPSATNQATLIVNFGGDKIRHFEGPAEPNTTILQALYFASLGGRFEVKYSVDPSGLVLLASIGDASNIGPKSWHFYLNGALISTDKIDKINIKGGDLIEIKYE